MKNKPKKSGSSKLRGIVLPNQWDIDGKIKRIALNTHDEKEYIIDFSGKGKDLLNHLQQMIEVDGKILTRVGGGRYIKVSDYTVLEASTS
ncbi:MAG: hypothetical protein LJE94_12350 [Deltaproteobacteria bacterium]|jgi:hypothetical protein|nr:hypothetical protein [Deltaproteobacteria bacterium]